MPERLDDLRRRAERIPDPLLVGELVREVVALAGEDVAAARAAVFSELSAQRAADDLSDEKTIPLAYVNGQYPTYNLDRQHQESLRLVSISAYRRPASGEIVLTLHLRDVHTVAEISVPTLVFVDGGNTHEILGRVQGSEIEFVFRPYSRDAFVTAAFLRFRVEQHEHKLAAVRSLELCAHCNGAGRIHPTPAVPTLVTLPWNRSHRCPACEGTGRRGPFAVGRSLEEHMRTLVLVIVKAAGPRACRDCAGAGTREGLTGLYYRRIEAVTCTRCRGRGTEACACTTRGGTPIHECSYCRGTGDEPLLSPEVVSGALPLSSSEHDRVICPGCNNEIDPDTCGCGGARATHNAYVDGYVFVPQGCDCLRSRSA